MSEKSSVGGVSSKDGSLRGVTSSSEHMPLIMAAPRTYGSLMPYYQFVRNVIGTSQTLHSSESMVSLCYRSLAGFINDDDLQGIRNFLENKQVIIDDRDENGATALILAATKGKLDFVRELLAHGADPNIEDTDSWTALHCAAKEGHVDICYELLQHDAKIDAREMGGWTPLMWACYKGRTQVVDLLLKRGADVNSHGNYYISSLLWAAGRGHTEIVEALIKHGAKVNMADKYGTTALIWASRKGHTEIVELLLKAGANVDTAGMYSWTALLVAAQGNHVEIVHHLLECKPNVNALDKDGCGALMIACKEGYYEVATALINANAYINIQDRAGDTNLIHAVKGGHRNIVEALLKKYADVDICGKDRKTAIYYAVEKGNSSIVKLLLNANPDLEIATKDGDTPLLKAVRSRNVDIVQLLLDKKAKVSATDKKGDTALHIAMRARSKHIVEILLRNPKHSQLLYRPNRAGETPYNIDMSHQKTILGQIFGARRLNTNEDNENMLGYDLYSSALADILSEPSLSMPITVGLYAKWGSGKSFLLNKLRDEMKNFAREWVDPSFKFTSVLFLVVTHFSFLFGVVVGLAVHSWIFGLISGGGVFMLCYFFIASVWFANKRYDWDWPYTFNAKLTRKLNSLRLILLVMFCHPPGAQVHDLFSVQPIRFYFTDQTRVSSTTGGENSVVQMLGSLYDAIENDYGTFATRLYRAFKPKPVKSSTTWKWRKICCIPYVLIFEITFLCILVGAYALTEYLVHLSKNEQTEQMKMERMTFQIVLIIIGLLIGITGITNIYTWNRMLLSLLFSQRRQLQKSIARLDTLKSEGFLQALKQEVNLMKDMVKCLDSLSAQQTRLVIIVDGLDSCEQDKVLLVLDAVHMLFSDSSSPFIVILAIDPHVIAKAVELNSRRLFHESNIGGHSYLSNMVHLPFYLQNSGLRKVKTAQQTAQNHRKTVSTWNENEESLNWCGSNMLGRSLSNRRLSAESGIMSSNEKLKFNSRKNSRKLKMSESVASSIGSNLNKIGGAQDLTKMLLTDDYFSDVNPRSMRRLMNVVYVTGRLLKAFQIDFNWYRLASWINITEQWPFRTSWIIYHYDMSEDTLDDNTSLKSLYDKARPFIPSLKETEPLLELDRDERKFDIFLSYHKSSLLVSDLKIFLPFTINLDPYLKKVIKEEMQSLEDAGIMMSSGRTMPVLPQVTPPTNMPSNWGGNNHDWQNTPTSTVNRRRTTFARPSVPVPPTIVYPSPPSIVGWQQPWGDPLSISHTARHAFPLAPITEIAPEILETKLSSLSVAGICDLMKNIPVLSTNAMELYKKVIHENNISGRVLLHCDLDELKKILKMTFGDWEIFRVLIVSMREQELSSVVTHRELKQRPLGFSKQAATTTTKERGSVPLMSTSSVEKEITVTQPDGSGSHVKNKSSVMEKQVTLEEQMICGALQTLNEEACEDVFEETEEKMRPRPSMDIPQTSVIPPSPESIQDVLFRSRANSIAEETDFVLLQSSPVGHWQPICVSLQNNSLSLSDQSSRSSSKSPSPVPEKRERANSVNYFSKGGFPEHPEPTTSTRKNKHVIIKDDNEMLGRIEPNNGKIPRPNSLYMSKRDTHAPCARNRSKSIDIALKKIKSHESKTISIEKLNKLKAKFISSHHHDLEDRESENESTPLMSETCSPVPSPEFASVFSPQNSASNSLPMSPSTTVRDDDDVPSEEDLQSSELLGSSPIKTSVHYTLSESSLHEMNEPCLSPEFKNIYRRPRTLSECAESPSSYDKSLMYSVSKSSLASNKAQSFGHLNRQNALDSDENLMDPETTV